MESSYPISGAAREENRRRASEDEEEHGIDGFSAVLDKGKARGRLKIAFVEQSDLNFI